MLYDSVKYWLKVKGNALVGKSAIQEEDKISLQNILKYLDREVVVVKGGDIRNREAVKKAMKDIDAVFSLAAQKHHSMSMKDPFTDIDINCRGIMNILEEAKETKPKIVFAGTTTQLKATQQCHARGGNSQLETFCVAINCSGDCYWNEMRKSRFILDYVLSTILNRSG